MSSLWKRNPRVIAIPVHGDTPRFIADDQHMLNRGVAFYAYSRYNLLNQTQFLQN